MLPRTSNDYFGEVTDASLSALLELSLTLGAYRDALVLVGGWVPFFLIDEFGRGVFAHVGSIDIDLAVNPEMIKDDGYLTIVELIQERGYSMRHGRDGRPVPFSYEKEIGERSYGHSHVISIDFLTCATSDPGSHRHRMVQSPLSARIANGCDLAFDHNFDKEIRGILLGNGESSTRIKMLDLAGCIGMKGVALGERYKEKDAYDIFSVISQCLDGPRAVAQVVKPFLAEESMRLGITNIRNKFRAIDAEGPSWVAAFQSGGDEMQRRRDQAESYAVVRRFLRELDTP